MNSCLQASDVCIESVCCDQREPEVKVIESAVRVEDHGVRKVERDQLLQRLQVKLAEWEEVLAEVQPDRITEAGVEGYYSAKDLLAHVMANTRWSAAQIKGVITGKPPTPMELYGQEEEPVLESVHFEHVNRWIFERYREVPYEDILKDFRSVFAGLIRSTQIASDEVLDQQAPWPGGPPIRKVIEGSHDHADEHLRTLVQWLRESSALT